MQFSFLNNSQQPQSAQPQSSSLLGQDVPASTAGDGNFSRLLDADQAADPQTEPNQAGSIDELKEEPILLNFQILAAKTASKNKTAQSDQRLVDQVNGQQSELAATNNADAPNDTEALTEQAILLPFNQDEIRKQIQPLAQARDQKSVQVTETPDEAVNVEPESGPNSEGITSADIKNCWKPASETLATESQVEAPQEVLSRINETVIVESSSRIVTQTSTEPNPIATIEIGGISNHAKTVAPPTIATPAAVPQQVAETFVQEISVSSKQGAKTITMQLHPAELGKLTVEIGWENDNVTASIVASDKATSELLIRDRQWLVNNLAGHGFDLSSFDVSYEGSSLDQGAEDMFGARSDSGRGKETHQSAKNQAEGNESGQDASEAEMLTQYLSGTGSVVNLVA